MDTICNEILHGEHTLKPADAIAPKPLAHLQLHNDVVGILVVLRDPSKLLNARITLF